MYKFNIGDVGSFSKTISESDVYNFAGISGDFNPVHVNKVMAENSMFKSRIVHGALVASYISTVLGMYMPGYGTIYLEQKSKFLKPVYIGDTITATAEIVFIDDENNNAILDTKVTNQNGNVVVEGKAKVKLPALEN